MTNRQHWRRDQPGFYNLLALERAAVDAPDVLEGLNGALMSRDVASRAETYVLELPPGFSGRTDAADAALEFFVLRGDLALNGAGVGASGYLQIPQLCGGGDITSARGALVLAFWNPNLPCYPYPVTRNLTVHTHAKEWLNSVPGGHGVMHKSLRIPDPVPQPGGEGFDGGPGGYLRFQYIAPQTIAEMEHVHHECWEEIILLQGDVLLINEGQMTVGSVVSHPQEWYHAPFVSRGGAVILVHTDGPMGYPWPPRPYPQGRRLCERYLAEAHWDEPVAHIEWADHALAAVQEDSADYQRWRESPGGERWGGSEPSAAVPCMPGGRGQASDFRGGWRRAGAKSPGTQG